MVETFPTIERTDTKSPKVLKRVELNWLDATNSDNMTYESEHFDS